MDRVIPEVFDDLEIGITLHDPETGEIRGVNQRLEELYGYTATELREMSVADYTADDPEFTQADAERRIRAAAEGEPQAFEWRVKRSSGECVWVRVRLARTELDGESYVIAEIRNITERKEREQELRVKNKAIEQAPVGVTLTDATQESNPLVYANEEFLAITGYNREEAIGWNHKQLQGPETSDAAIEEFRTAIDNEESTTIELRNYRNDGELFWNSVSIAPVHDDSGELRHWVGFQDDITDRKKREEELAELHTATSSLMGATTSQEVAEIASETAEDVLGFSVNSVNFYDESAGGLVPAACSETTGELFGTPPVLDSGLAWESYQQNEVRLHADLDAADGLYNPETKLGSEMLVPFGEYGILIVASTETDAFDQTDLSLAKVLAANIKSTLDRTEQKQELETERAFIQKSLDTIEDAFYMLDPNGNIERWNDAVNEITGYTDEELAEMHAMEFFPDSDQAMIAEVISEILDTGSAVVESEFVTKDGRQIPYEFTGTRFVDDDGKLQGILGTGRDIAERKQRLETLKQQEVAFRKIHQTASRSLPLEEKVAELLEFGRQYMGVEQGFFTQFSDGTQEISVGVGPNEQLQNGATAPVPESYCRHTVDPETDSPLTVTNAPEEGWEDDPAYERFGLACYAGSAVTVEGETVGTICFADRNPADKEFSEIQETFVELLTEWISYEFERAEREKKYRRLTERISDAYYAVDTEFTVTFWNDVIADRLGMPAEEVVGENFWELFPESEGTDVERRFCEALDSQQPTSLEYYYEERDYWTELQVYPDEDGLAVISKDITDRKEYEAQLERSNERLQQFAYILSHDLQEPLRMVSSYIDLLKMELDDLDEETEEYMQFAIDGANRMRSMIDGLLQYSRVETDGVAFEETDIAAMLDGVEQDLHLMLDEAGAELQIGELPTLTADTEQVGQLFQNLITNAVDHGGAGTTVEISAEEISAGYEFAVSDDGPGIPADEQDGIFDLFDKGTDSDGTGIGLAVCERIVNRHDGDIWVESTEGEGATFYFTLETE